MSTLVARRCDARNMLRLASAGAALAIGAVGLVGWSTSTDWLLRFGDDFVTMKFNTAVLVCLLALSFLVRSHRLVFLLRLVALVVACLSVSQDIGGWNLGIDELVVGDPASTDQPGRMSATTAVGFVLIALGGRAAVTGRRVVAQIAGAVVVLIAWLAVLGYLFGAEALYAIGPLSSMALPTAIAVAMLGIALQASIPGGVLDWLAVGGDAGSQLGRRFLPIGLVVLPVLARLVLTAANAGWIREEFALALTVLGASLVVITVSLPLGRRLALVDEHRRLVLDELAEANASLEERVEERAAALVESEARARSVAAAAPVGIFHTDLDGRATFVNDRWREIYGGAADDDLHEVWARAIHPDDADRVVATWQAVLDGGGPFDCEYRVQRPEVGTVGRQPTLRWVHVRSCPVIGVDGVPTGHVGTVEDTTEQRRAEAEFRAAFESAPIGMALVGPDGAIVRANGALATMLGTPVPTPQRASVQHLVHPDDQLLDEGGEMLGVTHRERRLLREDGGEVWVSLRQTTVQVDSDPSPGARHERGYTLVQFVDVSEQRRFAEQMAHLANHDPLTGLLNRRAFEAALEQHVNRVARYGAEGAVLLLDLDHFKRINDTYGHSVGDQVIVHVAHALRSRLRTSDLVARLGGDEFAVLLPSGGPEEARRVADILVGAVRAATTTIGGHRLTLSTSIGLAAFDDEERTADEVMVNADLAMYDAKEEGRDRWFEYSRDRYDEPRTRARLGWIERIERALDEDRFTLHAQPVVDLVSGRTVKLELLVRMLSDQGETIPPGTFLYVAERYGLITRIDSWVLAQAIEMLAETERAGEPVTLAVNLSGPSLGDPALLAMIEEAVQIGRFEPSRLVLEVTETSAVRNIGAARAFAERLHEVGCRFALDDFGAGFGSFYYLKHLPFDYIKIDGEFVTNCLESRTDQAIIRSLVALARELGTETVAEHVPDDRTVRFLRRLGVDYGQGFHLGRPVDLPTALADLVRTGGQRVIGRISSRAS